MLTAQAEADKIRFIGEAEASSIEAVGKAEAEKMRLKAEAYLQYGEAAKTALVLEALPMVCGSHLYTNIWEVWFIGVINAHHERVGTNVICVLKDNTCHKKWLIYIYIQQTIFTIR